MALLARGHVYGEDILCDAPKAREIKRTGKQLAIEFDFAEGGLTIMNGELSALKVISNDYEAGAETEYEARSEGETLIIDMKESIDGKIKVEFAQTPWYQVNLYNQAGIPAIPFVFEC